MRGIRCVPVPRSAARHHDMAEAVATVHAPARAQADHATRDAEHLRRWRAPGRRHTMDAADSLARGDLRAEFDKRRGPDFQYTTRLADRKPALDYRK